MWVSNNNDENFASASDRTDPAMRQNINSDKSFDLINNIDWKKESDYHNTYYLGKGKYGTRTLKKK